jgi:hypothetical protein
MTTTVVKTIKSSGGDYTKLSDFVTWLNSQDLVALDIVVDCQVFISLTTGNILYYNSLRPANADATHYCTIRPAPGYGFKDLDVSGAEDYGTVGVELDWNGPDYDFTVGPGIRLTGFRIILRSTTGHNMVIGSGGYVGAGNPGAIQLYQNRIKFSAGTLAMLLGTRPSTFTDNTVIIDTTTGKFATHGGTNTNSYERNTFVQRNGANGIILEATASNAGAVRDNMFRDCPAVPITRTTYTWATISNNFSNVTITGTSTGFTVNTGTNALTQGNANSFPTAAGPLIGAASSAAIGSYDVFNAFRGATPDVGSRQLTPSAPAPTATITSMVVDGQSLTISGTTTGTPTSGLATLGVGSPANGAIQQGPTALTLGTGTFTVTFTGIPPGSYASPTVTVTSSTGTTAATGGSTFTVAGVSGGGDVSQAATGLTLTGPSSGLPSVASTPFTVTANGTLAGSGTVTPSDGGAGGTFTPTSVTLNSSTLSATFTYTPPAAGSYVISLTNSLGLTNLNTLTYQANSSLGAAGFRYNGAWYSLTNPVKGYKTGGTWYAQASVAVKGFKRNGVWTVDV